MEQGYGHNSSSMIVVNSPSQELSFTNFAYCSAGDFRKFAIQASNYIQVMLGDSLVLPLFHGNVSDGHIALNSVHRRQTKVSIGDQISVIIFFPPDNFSLPSLTLELSYVKAKANRNEELDAVILAQHLQKNFRNQVMTIGQQVLFEFLGTNYIFTVKHALVEDEETNAVERGIITNDTYVVFEAASNSGIKVINLCKAASSNIIRQKKIDLQNLGIGGLRKEFDLIFSKAFASRSFPPHVTNKMDIKHVKGVLLYGPPGTGKTLMARQFGKLLNIREPKIFNGSEILSTYIGRNVIDLFADAEQDQRARGDQSDLHVIIIDDIDAICKSRGSTRDGTGVGDDIVKQLLTKIDGVFEALNNVLLIATTNRKDLLDDALLRPGRLEVLVEINLPDENARLEILKIHTKKMKENSFLAADVNLQELAARTRNYTGADLEGVVRSAASFAYARKINMNDLDETLDEENLEVTMNDFLKGLQEIIPAFGPSTDDP